MNDSPAAPGVVPALAARPIRQRLEVCERPLSLRVLAGMIAGGAEELANGGSCCGPRGCCG